MFHRALSLFLLFSFSSLYPAHWVEFVTHGVKDIVIPAVVSVATGVSAHKSLSRRSRDTFFLDNQMENRGVAKGTQSRSYNQYSANEAPIGSMEYRNNPQYTANGVPTHNADGTPNEEFFKEQYRRATHLHQDNKDQNKGWPAVKVEDIKKVGSGGGNKEPDKDPKKGPQSDPTKHRRKKLSDQRHDNPLPDPRTCGKTGKDLIFPTKDNPGQYIHQFDKREGHIQELTNKARSKLWDCFEKGRFLGQDATGGFNFDYIDPETGYQIWMRTRPDGKVVDCGANTVHWGLSEEGFLEKPWDLSQELKDGVYFADTVLNSPVSKAIGVAMMAEEWRKDALEKISDKELQDFLGNVSAGFQKRDPTAKEIKQRAEADKFSQLEYESARKKLELSRLPKPNPNAMIEIAPPKPVIKPVQPSAMVLADVSPPKREREESSGGGSSSSSGSSLKLSSSQMNSVLSSAGPRPSSGGSTGALNLGSYGPISSGAFSGGVKLGGGTFTPGSFGKLSISAPSQADDDDDDDYDDMLDDDDDDDDDYGKCTGMGCI